MPQIKELCEFFELSIMSDPASTSPAAVKYATEEEIRTIAAYTNQVPLSGKQKDKIMKIWLECNSSIERQQIGMLYPRLFSDSAFVHRLMALLAQRGKQAGIGLDESGSSEKSNSKKQDASSSTPNPSVMGQLLMLRKAVEAAVAKLSGPGPFTIEFGLVIDEVTNREVIELFNSQFVNPDLAVLQKMITVPKRTSTRSRQKAGGNLTWFIRSVNNNGEIACAVSCHIHANATLRFMEVPLFATKAGYQKMGLARLLTAALKDFCVQEGMHYLLVSADVKAVPFWTTLGFAKLELSLRQSIDKDECYDFKGSEVMRWKVPEQEIVMSSSSEEDSDDDNERKGAPSSLKDDEGYVESDDNATNEADETRYVAEALQRMDKFLLKGPLSLPKLPTDFGGRVRY